MCPLLALLIILSHSCKVFSREPFDTLPEKETRQQKLPGALLSTEEAADYLAISAETLRCLCRWKAITFIQVTPSECRFQLADLDEYIASRRNKRGKGCTLKARLRDFPDDVLDHI
jgi:excisionase family DNA binding protein